MSRRVASLFLSVATAVIIFILDQRMKARWLVASDDPMGFSYLHGWIQSINFHNHGITFSLPLPTILTLLVTFIALAWLGREASCAYREDARTELLCIALVAGGALGNAYDRIVFQYVRDWLLLWFRSAINFADISIVVGALSYIWLRTRKKSYHQLQSS
jgi:signal peptidase II